MVTTDVAQRTDDVAVIGSGFAGLAAAIEASNASPKTSIVVLEKMDSFGGNSVMNAGQIAVVGSEQQKKAGIEDSIELMANDMMVAGVHLNYPDLLQTMIRTGTAESNGLVTFWESSIETEFLSLVATQFHEH